MSAKKMNENLDELKWIRIFTPIHIPKYLVEQVRDRDFSVEDFYKYQESSCLTKSNDEPRLNPLNHLYILVNDENLTKGFLWFVIDPLSKNVFVNTFSVDKEYWNKGFAVRKLSEFMKEFLIKSKLKKVYWITNYPKHSEHYDFKRSKSVLMEYMEKEENG